ncbi:MAG: hypothetical protein AB8G22_20075 [Saprospiraceae bacterium]
MKKQNQQLDKEFFARLKKLESYFQRHAKENEAFNENYHAAKKINEILNQNLLSADIVEQVIQIFHAANEKPHHDGSGWLDLKLHLAQLADFFDNHNDE